MHWGMIITGNESVEQHKFKNFQTKRKFNVLENTSFQTANPKTKDISRKKKKKCILYTNAKKKRFIENVA